MSRHFATLPEAQDCLDALEREGVAAELLVIGQGFEVVWEQDCGSGLPAAGLEEEE